MILLDRERALERLGKVEGATLRGRPRRAAAHDDEQHARQQLDYAEEGTTTSPTEGSGSACQRASPLLSHRQTGVSPLALMLVGGKPHFVRWLAMHCGNVWTISLPGTGPRRRETRGHRSVISASSHSA